MAFSVKSFDLYLEDDDYNNVEYISLENNSLENNSLKNNSITNNIILDKIVKNEEIIYINKLNYSKYFTLDGYLEKHIKKIVILENLVITENIFMILEDIELDGRGNIIEICLQNYQGLFYLRNSKIINLNIKQGKLSSLKKNIEKSWLLKQNCNGSVINCSFIIEKPNKLGYIYIDKIDYLLIN